MKLYSYICILLVCLVSFASIAQDTLLPVSREGKFGYINTQGELVIDYQFKQAEQFREGRARVRVKEGYYQFIDVNGQFTCDTFRFVHEYHQGLAVACTGSGEAGFIDTAGNWVIRPGFRCYGGASFNNNLAVILKDQRYYVIEKKVIFFMKSQVS